MEQKDISSTQKQFWPLDEDGSIRTVQLAYVFLFFFLKRKLPITLISRSILSKGKNLSDGHYNFSLDFRAFWGCGDGIFGWNEILQRVSWVGILKEKSTRKESGELWRSIRNQSPLQGTLATPQNRYFTHLIEMSKKFGDISEKDTIFTDSKISPKFRYFYRFFGKFSNISYQFRPRTGYKICPIFFLKKNRRCYLVIWSWFASKGCVFPGSKILDLGFVKFKSNGTKAKRPLKQI